VCGRLRVWRDFWRRARSPSDAATHGVDSSISCAVVLLLLLLVVVVVVLVLAVVEDIPPNPPNAAVSIVVRVCS